MQTWKKGLASLLTLLMLVSALPVTALAAEQPDASVPDEVVYNLETMDVTVGSDPEKAETAEVPYVLFDEDGNYTLNLGPDAFFPYEVQFTYGGDTWTEWFMDAGDTVEIGGHVFSVETYVSNPAALTGLSFEIAGRTVTAYPEEKAFTNDGPGIALMSLLPLEERELRVNMEGLFPAELKAVPVTTVLSGDRNPAAGDYAVWAKGYNSDDFTIVGRDGTVDLSPEDRYDNYVQLEMIVGTDDQLDISNVRYIVDVRVTPSEDLLRFTAAAEDGTEVPIARTNLYEGYFYDAGEEKDAYRLDISQSYWNGESPLRLSMDLNEDFGDVTPTVYLGYYETAEAIPAGAEDVTAQVWGADASGYPAKYVYEYVNGKRVLPPAFTVVFHRGEDTVWVLPFVAYTYLNSISVSMSYYYAQTASGRTYVSTSYDYDDATQESCSVLPAGYSASDTYYIGARVRLPDENGSYTAADWGDTTYVKAAYIGSYFSEKAAQAAGATDIKGQLFSDPSNEGGGYGMVFNSEKIVTIILEKDGTSRIYRYYIDRLIESPELELPDAPRPDSEDTYFRVETARAVTEDGTSSLDCYVMPYEHDGYYYNGYQTVFLLNDDGTPVTAESIVPEFYTGSSVTMYAGLDHISGAEQISGQTAIPFRNGETVPYSASAQSRNHLKNYWVTFLTRQTGGPSLFVNAANDPDRVDEETGLPVREIYLTPEFDYHHDVFFANIGDADMTGIYVRLENAENVALDDYWTVREDAPDENRTLAAFTTTDEKDADGNWVYYGELPNVAKIRLVPMEDSVGAISGTLVIGYQTAGGKGEEVKIKLTGTSGTPKITTETIVDGVKYVPYNSVIQTNSMGASDAIEFRVTEGSLPTGVTLYPNGKLYGMPTKAGDYTFTVTAVYGGDASLCDTKTFTVTIKENTSANVDASTDTGYELKTRVPDILLRYTDQEFVSAGEYGYFYKFYLDGKELTEGQDYDSESGSTKITIRAQTFQNAGSGTHTISAEFRTNKTDTNTVKRAAQNYTVSGSGGASGGASKPNIKPTTPATPSTPSETPKTTADIFRDVSAGDWFYPDVDWGYQNKLMIGVTSDLYKPRDLISAATVVTVLARLDKADLSAWADVSYPEIAQGQWYTNAAVWARSIGILPEGTFSAQPPIARAKFAVMLVKYLESRGIDCALPEQPVAFADADLMTQEENDAFQVLYQFGIFKGTGNYFMDPQGSTTRAQLAVLLHRLSVFTEQQAAR